MKVLDKFYWKAKSAVAKFLYEENGDVNIVSIVILIGIAVALAIIFRKAIGGLINDLLEDIQTDGGSAGSTSNTGFGGAPQ